MVSSSRKITTAKTVKTATKSVKPVAKKVQTAPVRKAIPATPTKTAKPKKPKLVRDSFTIPKTEYLVLDDLKQRAIQLAHPVKKSELLRAGIKALTAMTDAALLTALKAVPTIKTGRPKKA